MPLHAVTIAGAAIIMALAAVSPVAVYIVCAVLALALIATIKAGARA